MQSSPSDDNHAWLPTGDKLQFWTQSWDREMLSIWRTLELGLRPDTSLWVPQVVPNFVALPPLLKPPLHWLSLLNSGLLQELQLLPATPGMSLVPHCWLSGTLGAGAQCRQQSKTPCTLLNHVFCTAGSVRTVLETSQTKRKCTCPPQQRNRGKLLLFVLV